MPNLDENGNPIPGSGVTNNPDNATAATSSVNIKKQLLPSKYDGSRYHSNANMKPQWIVIHNVGPGSAKACYNTFNDPNGRNVSTHFTCDDKEIIQMLEVSWKGIHTNGNAMSKGGCSEWAGGKAPAVPCGANNSNSIGIEVGNNGGGVTSVNEAKALEVAIELTRYLMKELNIDADHVVRHGDTQPKNCPSSIMKNGGENWVYFKEQLKTRNEQNKPINLSTSNISVQPGNNMGSPSTGGGGGATQLSTGGYGTTLLDTPLYASPTDIEVQLPDVDHRENTTNMDEVTGVSLIFYPPYNSCEAENRENYFTELKYDRTYHYVIGKGYESKTPEGGTEDEGSDTPEAEPTMFMSRIMPRSKYVAYVGDSLTKGMGDAMPNLTVYATEGHTVGEGYSAYADKIVADKPLVVIMCYGTNDAVNGSSGIDKFKTDYKKFVKHLKDNIPNVQVFINTIPPGDSSKATNSGYKTAIQNIPSYNAVLSEIAAEGATVIDATSGITGDSYSSDGLHMTEQAYKDWHEAIEGQINKDSDPDDDEGGEPGTGTNPGGGEAPPLVLPEGDPVGGDKDLESANGFAIKAWIDEKKQSQGFTDNDTHTYIDRALFKSKKEKHNLTVALMCPMPEKDPETGKYKPDSVDYPAYEKALIEGLAVILHEHGLEVKDLWREFDLNRAPSPFLYLERDAWKDLLTEVEKQLNWRIAKYGAYTKTFTKYSAGSSGLSGGSTGSIGAGTIGGGSSLGGTTGGTGPDIGNISDNAQAAWTYFTGAGFTPQCTAGIMGNLQQESGIEPTKEQYGGGPGRGIGQWTVSEERFAGLKAHASSKGKDWTDLQSQLEWVDLELQGKDSSTLSHLKRLCGGYDAFKQLTDLRRACDIFEQAFERAGKPMMENRYKYAEQFYSKFSTSSGGGTDSGGGTGTLPPLEEASLEPVLFTNKPQARTGTVYGWPLPGISKVSSKFGPRTPPCAGASSMHGGIDIGAASGTPIMSYAAGTVVQNVAWNKSAGNYIKIDHGTNENGEKVESRYLHMVEPSPLKVGETVTAGQQVGKVGNTGVGTGAHLHFEIHINGTKVDPLKYVNPGGGTVGNPTVTPGAGGGGGTTSTPTVGGGGGGTIGSPSSGLLYDDIKQPNTNGVIEGNSAGGQNHDDWGGVMTYKKGSPTDESAEQPEIITIITKEMYADLIEYSDPKIVDDYTMDFEPYSKGLASVDDNQIDISDRISAMTKQFITRNENTFHYKVIESGPGSKDHCVTVAEELNYLAVPQDLKVEPIYPDLVIPPGYISTEADKASPNSIPVAVVQEGGITSSDSYTKQLSFDYDLLKEQVKLSNKRHHPINYTDPYPYDEKITDLERHYPKVFIDEIEGQLYSCNHPGCPISQPMAKNFAMVSDAMMNQSKRIEKRLSRIENILATIIRNQGRLGARMNINCVYYGGHSTFGKYKCIRCLHDDRVNDGQLVTVDQCLNCTRFEPILGQVYRILDDSGLNGSIILDDMQMSYTDLEGFRNLNDITHRSSKYFNAKATEEKNCVKPVQTLIEMYKLADKEQAVEQIRKESTDESEAQKKIDELKEEDYIFKMDWTETFFNSQEPDTKLYPNEGIVARSKVDLEGDGPHTLEDEIAELDPTTDADVIEELKEQIKIRDNIWVDTRNTSDAIQANKYSSENYFFEDFNKVRIGKYGIKFSTLYNYNGEDYNNVYSGTGTPGSQATLLNNSNPGSAFASQVRDKIVEMAKKILQDCNDGKAWYSQPYRTTEYDKPVTIKSGNGAGKTGYDCTSFVSCCYMYAGLKSMYAKSCSGGTLVREIQKGGKMIPCNSENMKYILPGDILLTASGTVTQNQCNQLAFITTSHAAIYVGNNQIIHARGKNYGIQASNMDYYLTKGNYVFVRPADLLEADNIAAQQSQTNTGGSGGVEETSGTIDGKSYVAKIPGAVCTAYTGSGAGASGLGCVYNSTCASHNMPYGTKIYVPGLAGKAGNGVFTVTDTGGCFFDFDIFTNTWNSKENMDAYILEWGSGKIAKSYTWAMDLYNSRGTWGKLKSAWVNYKNMGGKLVNFLKYNQEDTNIKNHPNYNS